MELLESQTTILSDRRLGSFKLSSEVDGGRKGARADDDIRRTILLAEGVFIFSSKWYYQIHKHVIELCISMYGVRWQQL